MKSSMGFDISFGSQSSGLNIGFRNPSGIDANFGSNTHFDVSPTPQQPMNAGFSSGGQLDTGFNSSSPMTADFGSAGQIYYDTEENWNAQRQLIAKRKAIYVYSNHSYIEDEIGNKTYIPALKIGDGTSYLIDMPFVSDDIRKELMDHISADGIHVTERDRWFWNNKVCAYVLRNDPERLILSKDIIM